MLPYPSRRIADIVLFAFRYHFVKCYIPVLVLASTLPSLSQDQANSQGRTCRLIYLQRPADAPTNAYLFDGRVSHKADLPTMNFSEVISLPEGEITLAMTPDEVIDPKQFPSGAPNVKVPASVRDLYLIVATDPTNKVMPIRMLALDVSVDKLKPGQTIWINLTTHRVVGKLGDETLDVPGGSRVVGKAPVPNNGYYKAQFAYQPQGQKQFLPIMKKSWWHDGTSKNLGFIIDSGGRLPKIFTFRDHRSQEINEKDAE